MKRPAQGSVGKLGRNKQPKPNSETREGTEKQKKETDHSNSGINSILNLNVA